jgi:uncharacterized membrane protein YkvA (DUF1232 family)
MLMSNLSSKENKKLAGKGNINERPSSNDKHFVISTYHSPESTEVKSKRPGIAAMASYFIIPFWIAPDLLIRELTGL